MLWDYCEHNFFLSLVLLHFVVTLPEPVKLRAVDANEDAKLTEFQEELVQMAATLCGDHKKDTYPLKLVENMTVGQAVEYVNNAFKDFLDECEKARESGGDGDHICVPGGLVPPVPAEKSKKSFASMFLSCIACGNNN